MYLQLEISTSGSFIMNEADLKRKWDFSEMSWKRWFGCLSRHLDEGTVTPCQPHLTNDRHRQTLQLEVSRRLHCVKKVQIE